MDTFKKFSVSWTKRVAMGLMSLLILSCSNDHESENDHSFETEFENNYRAVAEQISEQRQYQTELSALKNSNFDAYRSIAFTWHTAAMESCRPTKRGEQLTTPKSSYQQLLEANQPSTRETISIDSETRDCIQVFFTRNWKKINAMIKLN